MANYTRKAILQTFQQMLLEKPFEKITVSALVVRCEISSNTFYYHFRDIYDLLDAWLDWQKQQILANSAADKTWNTVLKVLLHRMQDNPRIVYHLSDSISLERMEQYVFASVEPMIFDYVRRIAPGIPEEKLQRMTTFYCNSMLGFLIRFLWEDMKQDVDKNVEELDKLFTGAMQGILN